MPATLKEPAQARQVGGARRMSIRRASTESGATVDTGRARMRCVVVGPLTILVAHPSGRVLVHAAHLSPGVHARRDAVMPRHPSTMQAPAATIRDLVDSEAIEGSRPRLREAQA
jgi:hypothetical protein